MQKVLVYENESSSGKESAAIKVNCRKVTVTPDARLTNAPVETGVLINDCKVRQPTVITMEVVLPISGSWYGVIEKIRNLHEKFSSGQAMEAKSSNLAVVQTRDGIYRNLVLLNCPHAEGVDNFSTFEFTLKFQELILAGGDSTSSVKEPKDKSDSNPFSGGQRF